MSIYKNISYIGNRARRTDPGTSHEAARRSTAALLPTLDDDILAALKAAEPLGLTIRELADRLPHRRHVSISPRTKPLETMGKIRRGRVRSTGELFKRSHPESGMPGIVWLLTKPPNSGEKS